jgi:hypothetical protein
VGGETDVRAEHVGATRARQPSGLCMQAQRRDADGASDRPPRLQRVGRLWPPGEGSLPAPLAQHPDRRGGMERDGGAGPGEELGHPQSSRKAPVAHGAIAYSRARAEIRGLPNGGHLGHGEGRDEWPSGVLRRTGEEPTALLHEGRHPLLDAGHERGAGGDARGARTGTMAPLRFERREKRHHQGRIERLSAALGRPLVQALARRRQQPLKRRRIARAGLRAGASWPGPPRASTRGAMWGQGCHDPPPEMNVSQVLARSSMRGGVRSRYPYVLATQGCPLYGVRARV